MRVNLYAGTIHKFVRDIYATKLQGKSNAHASEPQVSIAEPTLTDTHSAPVGSCVYAPNETELEQLVPNPLDYAKCVKIIGNEVLRE